MKKETKQNVTSKKPSRSLCLRRKYIIPAVIILLCIVAGLFYRAMTWQPKPDPESEAIIKQAVAAQLNKEPNDLIDEDFANIKELYFTDKELSDLKLLEKFINLQELHLFYAKYPESRIPKWMKILDKVGIIDLEERYSLDLRPLKKIYTLKSLDLRGAQISNISPLKRLINLEVLDIDSSLVSNLEPLKELVNLRLLGLNVTKVSNLEPLKELVNLQFLGLINTQVSNLEPIKGLINLQKLDIRSCPNITDEQVEDLQEALPDLKIER